MALTTFAPPVNPSPGTRHAPKADVLRADFGDGYTQAAPNGLNHIRQTLSFKWDGLTEAQYLAIIGFFDARGGYQPFWYHARGFAAPMKWVCAEWSGTDGAPWTVDAKFEQSFDPSV